MFISIFKVTKKYNDFTVQINSNKSSNDLSVIHLIIYEKNSKDAFKKIINEYVLDFDSYLW